ncbi:pitrilysin family protein [Tropicimonas sp. IMCC34011]|uniref:M16 family metallopeptidase n=1 Tax=Tropicimonas sp. IMCC34011 TaxID=2248759 RepID=UPI000E264EDB|nr:pitrilysin family protein [Tropicimonas sp. IMCC34011]
MILYRTVAAAGLALLAATAAQAEIDVEEITSPGGVEAWLVEEPSIPFVALELRFEGGASLDEDGKRGAINLMTGLLEEGAGDMDAEAFTIAKEELAASIQFDVWDDAFSVSARFLSEDIDEAMDLIHLALTEPRFDDRAVERVRAQVLSGLASDAVDPGSISQRTFDELAFGEHPYGSSLQGTPESVRALTADDLETARQRVLATDRIHVAAVGDIDAETLGRELDELLDGLPPEGPALPEDTAFEAGGGVTVVPFDTPQSVVTFGQAGIDRDDPDFFPAYVMNHILGGGGFESRLMEEVREKRGLTYGVGTALYSMDHADLLLGSVASANDRVAETVDVIRSEWERLSEEGVTEAELDRAKTYLTGAYPLRFDGNARIANILVSMQMDDLPVSYLEERNAMVEAVTLDDVARVADRLIDPDTLRFVVVGQPEDLQDTN